MLLHTTENMSKYTFRSDVPSEFGSRTVAQKEQDRKTEVYDDSKCTIKVSELLETVTRKQLHDLFSDFGKGKVKYVNVPRMRVKGTADEYTGRGFAFVTFVDEETARRALEYDKLRWEHTVIRVSMSEVPKRR